MKSLFRSRTLYVFAIIVALFVFVGEVFSKDDVIKIKFAISSDPESANGKSYGKFAELVNQRSNGRVEIEVFYFCKLGCDQTGVRNMFANTVQMTSISDANLGAFSDALYFMNLPYVFDSSKSLQKVMDEAWLREIIDKELAKKNLKALLFISNGGPRNLLTTKKPIKIPADVKGLKIKTTGSKVEVAIFEKLGALPTPINWDETYTALDQGTVDGEGLQYTWMYIGKHYEPVKNVCEISYVLGTHNVLVTLDFWKKLPADIQDTMTKAAKEVEEYAALIDQQSIEQAKEAIKKAGVKIYTPSKEEMNLWRDAVVPSVWDKFKDQASPELLKKIRGAQQ
jgi:TRAP-type transport system periplasmic protein